MPKANSPPPTDRQPNAAACESSKSTPVTWRQRGNSQYCSAYRPKQRDFQQSFSHVSEIRHMRKRSDNNGGGIANKLAGLPMPCRNEAMISGNKTWCGIGDQEHLIANVVSMNQPMAEMRFSIASILYLLVKVREGSGSGSVASRMSLRMLLFSCRKRGLAGE